MTFSMSLLVVLRSTMDQNALVVLYAFSLDLGIMTNVISLKCLG